MPYTPTGGYYKKTKRHVSKYTRWGSLKPEFGGTPINHGSAYAQHYKDQQYKYSVNKKKACIVICLCGPDSMELAKDAVKYLAAYGRVAPMKLLARLGVDVETGHPQSYVSSIGIQ